MCSQANLSSGYLIFESVNFDQTFLLKKYVIYLRAFWSWFGNDSIQILKIKPNIVSFLCKGANKVSDEKNKIAGFASSPLVSVSSVA